VPDLVIALPRPLDPATSFPEELLQRRFPVDHKIKSRHTANGILKHAGLPKAF